MIDTCKLCGTDLLRCSLFNFVCRTKLRHDFALKLESRLDAVDVCGSPPISFVVIINGTFVEYEYVENLLILMLIWTDYHTRKK